MTNKETIERNIGLTFDFVNHLIDSKEDLDKLPDNFTIEFVEKDFSKLQRRNSTHQTALDTKKIVHVKNAFVIA